MHEEEKMYLNEISRRLDLEKRNLAKKLNEFEREGLFNAEIKGNLKLYFLNKNFPLYNEYKKITMASFGLAAKLEAILKKVKGIEKAFIFGSYAKGEIDAASDIDIFVVGKHSIEDLQKEIAKIQREFDREINVISLSPQEYNKKQKDPFIKDIEQSKKINLI
ncbi:MAG: nucleotidyltransferase domain-containing protein [Pseudomonadota bacterium]